MPRPAADPGDVAAVAVAVHRVGVGHRRVAAGVGVAGEVDAADHLGGRERSRCGGADRGEGRSVGSLGSVVRRSGAGPAEARVHVVDAGVDDADPNAGTVGAGRQADGVRPHARERR